MHLDSTDAVCIVSVLAGHRGRDVFLGLGGLFRATLEVVEEEIQQLSVARILSFDPSRDLREHVEEVLLHAVADGSEIRASVPSGSPSFKRILVLGPQRHDLGLLRGRSAPRRGVEPTLELVDFGLTHRSHDGRRPR